MIGNGKITVKIEGIDSLLKLLNALPPNVSGKLMKPAMKSAGELLTMRARWNAYKVLRDAERRGYRRKQGRHLYETAGSRTKMYRKGETTYVAVGFNYSKGGYHAHLVELGHKIVRGGTLDRGSGRLPGITASGNRWIKSFGLMKGRIPKTALHGTKGRKRKDSKTVGYQYIGKRAWKVSADKTLIPGNWYETPGMTLFGRAVRGGGHVVTNKQGGALMTRKFKMLEPAFDQLRRPMMISIEIELKKIEAEAVRLAGNLKGGGQITGIGRSSAGGL
jgi:hypothetical protein